MEEVTGSNPVSTIALRGNNPVRTAVRLRPLPLAVVSSSSKDPVGRFVTLGYSVSQTHGTTGVKGFRRAGGFLV
jgi:hypothetical protein